MILSRACLGNNNLIEKKTDHISVKLSYFNLNGLRQETLSQEFDTAIKNNVVTEQDLKSFDIVFNSLYEGHGFTEFQNVVESLKHYSWFDPSRVIFLHNTFDKVPTGTRSVGLPSHMVEYAGWFKHHVDLSLDWDKIERKKFFLCLMRRRSLDRSKITREIRKNFSEDTYYLSYASMIDYTAWDDEAQCQIPILLDGATPGEQQHRVSDPRFFSCLINLIVETSNQTDKETYDSKFVSEKTFKCFAWHQIPIWWAVPNLVQDIRSFGFDMFDDVMDGHKYDSILDPENRRLAVISTLHNAVESIRNQGLHNVAMDMAHRLQSNYNVLENLVKSKYQVLERKLQRVKNL